MSRRLFLHIGTEKTATTSIQEFLYLNRSVLSDCGLALCDSMGTPNNQKLVAFFQNHIDDYLLDHGVLTVQGKEGFFEGFLEGLRSEIAGATAAGRSVLITSELFHSRLRDQESVQDLRDFLSSMFDEITIICYLREQSSLATSFYSTRIKSGEIDSLDSFLDGISEDSDYFNYYIFLSRWAHAFGRENIVVRLFQRSCFMNGNVLDDFLDALGLGHISGRLTGLAHHANEALGPIGVELGRRINAVFPRYLTDGTINDDRWRLMNLLATSKVGSAGKITNRRAGELYSMFLPSNRAVSKAFLMRDQDLFGDPRAEIHDGSIFSSNLEMTDAIVDFFDRICRLVVDDRTALREDGTALRAAMDRLLPWGVALGAAEDILKVAQRMNPEGSLIRDRLVLLERIRDLAGET